MTASTFYIVGRLYGIRSKTAVLLQVRFAFIAMARDTARDRDGMGLRFELFTTSTTRCSTSVFCLSQVRLSAYLWGIRLIRNPLAAAERAIRTKQRRSKAFMLLCVCVRVCEKEEKIDQIRRNITCSKMKEKYLKNDRLVNSNNVYCTIVSCQCVDLSTTK